MSKPPTKPPGKPPPRPPGAPPGGTPGKAPDGRPMAQKLRTARGRTTSQQMWLRRQLNDPYVEKAKREGYRSRAAFKLIELDEKFKLLRPGARVLDLGATPGGWTQVSVQKVGKKGAVLAVDINPMDAVPGATFLQLDFLSDDAEARVKELIGGPVDVVLSDMAAPATGHRLTDHIRIIALCDIAAHFATQVLNPGGAFVAKVLKGGTENELLTSLKKNFTMVRHAKPPASRADSAESYVVATGFRGSAKPDDE